MPTSFGNLRLLATSDLHMQITAHDYFTDKPDRAIGLARLADLITALRNDGLATMLFDNGDFVQGNPMADVAATKGAETPNPMILAMNRLGYDAVGLGNHEFNHGTDAVRSFAAQLACPLLCANLHPVNAPEFAQPGILIKREISCDDGTTRPLRLGVLSIAPPQVITWDQHVLHQSLRAEDMRDAAARTARQLRAAGADLIVALCHAGIGDEAHTPMMENAAIPVAAIPEIDVVIAGHTHEVFPGKTFAKTALIDPVAGTLCGKPSVMPGFHGAYLGQIDLRLSYTDAQGWRIAQSKTRAKAICDLADQTESPARREIASLVAPLHLETLHYIRRNVAATDDPLTSYFALVAPDATLAVLAQAQIAALRQSIADHPQWRDLPVVSAVASYRLGARGGAKHYVDIPAGPISMHDVAAIAPFADTLTALLCTGAQVRGWLEQSAAVFATVPKGAVDATLRDPRTPPYQFDVIFGLTYEIDLSKDTDRVRNLCHNGQPVADDAQLIVATNSYRAAGGGGHLSAPLPRALPLRPITVRHALADYLRGIGTMTADLTPVWRFAPMPGTTALFYSSTQAAAFIPSPQITPTGATSDGFAQFRLAF